MAVKKPGFSNVAGSRNTRVNRYAAVGDNREDRRHKQIEGTTLGHNDVPTPSEITDSGSGLAVLGFQVDELIESEGTVSNDGLDIIQTIAAGALGVDAALTTEAAGGQVTVRSRNNRIESRLA